MDYFEILIRDIEDLVFSQRNEKNSYEELMVKVVKELVKRYHVTSPNNN